MARARELEHALEAAAEVRLAARDVREAGAARRLQRVERLLRRQIGPSVPKRRAAALLGVSVTALDRWVRAGRVPVVQRPRGREEVESGALLDLVAEVRRVRDEGVRRGVIAAALRRLEERGLLRPSVRPNAPAAELRRSYLASSPVERLREAAELSRTATTLAAHGARREVVRPERRPPPLRFFDLLRVLRAHDVEFVVIGGFALAFHGAERATKDVDVVPAPSEENLERLRLALQELDAEPQGLEDWILHTRFGRLDVMQWVAPFDSYDELRKNAVEVELAEVGSTILVAGLHELIAMKEAAGRDQDRIDIATLRMAHGLEE